MLVWPGTIVSIFRRTTGMHVHGNRTAAQPFQQAGRKIEIGLVDQLPVCLERVRSKGHTIEDGPWSDFFKEPVKIGINEQIDDMDFICRDSIQSPGWQATCSTVDITPHAQDRPQEIRADEAAGSQHQDRSVQTSYCGRHEFRKRRDRCHWREASHLAASSSKVPSKLAGSSPHSAR